MNLNTKKRVQAVDVAKQWFKPSLKSVVDALIAKGDVFGCAGGFLVDDDLVTPHLDKREGDEDSIIGMPIQLTRRLIREVLL